MSMLSFLASLLLPLQFCMFGVLVAILPALLGLFTVQLFLPVRYLWALAPGWYAQVKKNVVPDCML